MSRTVLRGGLVFDGSGAAPRELDVALAGGRIVELGAAFSGDTVVDVQGALVGPGLID